MGGYPNQAQYPIQEQRQITKENWHEEVQQPQPKTFEQKSKDAIIFIGENWGYSGILVALIGFYYGNKFKSQIKHKVKKLISKW